MSTPFGVVGALAFSAASMWFSTVQAAPVNLGNAEVGIYLKDFPDLPPDF